MFSPDIIVEYHHPNANIVMLQPRSKLGEQWLNENTQGTWFAGKMAVEPRYIDDLLKAMRADHLVLQKRDWPDTGRW